MKITLNKFGVGVIFTLAVLMMITVSSALVPTDFTNGGGRPLNASYFNNLGNTVNYHDSVINSTVATKVYGTMPTQAQLQADLNNDYAAGRYRTYELPAGVLTTTSAITLHVGQSLVGQGENNTAISLAAGSDANIIIVAEYSHLENIKILIPSSSTHDAVIASSANCFRMENIYIYGGNNADAFAIRVSNSIYYVMDKVFILTSFNGIRIENTNNLINYGNSEFNHVQVQVQSTNRVGWSIESTVAKTVNLLNFNYCGSHQLVSLGSGTGTGLYIKAGHNSFSMLDIEGFPTAINLSGVDNVITGLYAPATVVILPGAGGNTFVGGIAGAVIDGCYGTSTPNVFKGLKYPNETQYKGIDQTALVSLGPKAVSPGGITLRLSNRVTGIVPAGTVMARNTGSIAWGVRIADPGLAKDWLGIMIGNNTGIADCDVGIVGVFPVLCNTTANNSDYLVLDTGTPGSVKSVGKTLTKDDVYVGIAMRSITEPGLVDVFTTGFWPVVA